MQFEPSPHFTKGQSGVDVCQFFQKGGGVVPKKGQGFRNQKSWYTLFRTPNNMFACTIVHLTFRAPQTVVRACTLTSTSPCTCCKDKNILEWKVNLRFFPLSINPEYILGIQTFFIEKETTDGSLVYPEQTTRHFSVNYASKQ